MSRKTGPAASAATSVRVEMTEISEITLGESEFPAALERMALERMLLERMQSDWDEPETDGQTPAADQDRLQGTWLCVSGPLGAEFLFAGSHYAARFQDGRIYMGTFALDGAVQPKGMDMRIEEGPTKHVGKTTHCIYELDGDSFRWCAGKPGSEHAPLEFPDAADPRFLQLVLRRV